MSDMVERVARAIKAEVPQGYGMTEEDARSYARAAIVAMREPTPSMVDAGRNVEPLHSGPGDLWQAMIDAALSEVRK